ncbi:MAG TPA: hypothetical protein PK954_03685 [Anaerolineales bacterium]|nr:hypothetical protein [Anaerolineales bacterium]
MSELKRHLPKIPIDTAATSPATTPEAARRVEVGLGDPDCPLCHGLGYIRREDLSLTDPAFGKVQVCTCQAEHLLAQRAAKLRADSNIAALADKTFETFLPSGTSPDPVVQAQLRKAYDSCRSFAQNPARPDEHEPDRKWLLLMGSYGAGKTHLAAAIANQCLRDGKPALFLNTPARPTARPSARPTANASTRSVTRRCSSSTTWAQRARRPGPSKSCTSCSTRATTRSCRP